MQNRACWIACCFAALAACASHVSDSTQRVSCAANIDCATAVGGGECVSAVCRATNECATATECAAGELCVRVSAFGALCTPPDRTPVPLPAVQCVGATATTAVCPATATCGPDLLCHPRACDDDDDCPVGERCDPICDPSASATSPITTVRVCEPAGLPIQVCPPPPPQCTSDADCPTGERCNPICSSTGTAGHECQPDGVPTQICP